MNDEIERAIDSAEARNGGTPEPDVVPVGLPLIREAMELPPDGGIRFNQLAEHVGQPRVLLLDVTIGAWRPVLLPVGTWALQAATDEPAKPKLWTP